jgi:hypothetical protein
MKIQIKNSRRRWHILIPDRVGIPQRKGEKVLDAKFNVEAESYTNFDSTSQDEEQYSVWGGIATRKNWTRNPSLLSHVEQLQKKTSSSHLFGGKIRKKIR